MGRVSRHLPLIRLETRHFEYVHTDVLGVPWHCPYDILVGFWRGFQVLVPGTILQCTVVRTLVGLSRVLVVYMYPWFEL